MLKTWININYSKSYFESQGDKKFKNNTRYKYSYITISTAK